jgi:hypothetical protein
MDEAAVHKRGVPEVQWRGGSSGAIKSADQQTNTQVVLTTTQTLTIHRWATILWIQDSMKKVRSVLKCWGG